MALRANRAGNAGAAPQAAGVAPQTAPAAAPQQPVYQAPPAAAPAPQPVYQEAAPVYQAPPAAPQQPVYQAPPAAAPVYQEAPQYQAPPAAAPAPVYAAPPAAAPGSLQDLNAGILDNIDDMETGNYVTVDGSDFLYKASQETVKDITAVIHYGKRYYQWVDESVEPKQFHDSPTKLDDRYKLKFEIRWMEVVDDEEVEHIMSLSTTSAIQFMNYVKGLAKSGYGVNQVNTQMTISRHLRKGSQDRYSRVDFKAI